MHESQKQPAEPDPVRKQAVELRLIVKQVQVTIKSSSKTGNQGGDYDDPDPLPQQGNKARVTFCRNQKKNKVMATDWKEVD